MPKIIVQKNGKLNDDDRFELLRLLGKAGYVVWIGKQKRNQNGNYETYVGFVEPERSEEIGKTL